MVSSFFKNLDIFTLKYPFYHKNRSILGGVFTFLFILLSILCLYILICSVRNKNNPIYNYSVETVQSNLISQTIDDKYIEIQINSKFLTDEMLSRIELTSKFMKKNDKSFIIVAHHRCNQNETMLCYRFYLDDYKIFHQSLGEKLVYDLKVFLIYNCDAYCENDSLYLNSMLKQELTGFIVDNVYSPLNDTTPVSNIINQFFSLNINSLQYSSIDIKMKRKKIIDDKSNFFFFHKENSTSIFLAMDKTFTKSIYYDNNNNLDKNKKILLNFNIDFISRTTDVLTRKYDKFEDCFPKVVAIMFTVALIFYLITDFISSKKRNLKLINKIFDFFDDNDKMNILKTKKMLERKSVSMINLKEKLLPFTEIVTEDIEDEVKIIDQTLDLDVLSDDNENVKQAKKIISCKNLGAKKRLIDMKDRRIKELLPNNVNPRIIVAGRPAFVQKFSRKHQLQPLEKIDEENIEECKQTVLNSPTNFAISYSRKESSSELDVMASPNRKFHDSPKKPSEVVRKLGTYNLSNINQIEHNLSNPRRKDSGLIGDLMLAMNSKKKLEISLLEFIFIAMGFHYCNKDLSKKNDLYKKSLKYLDILLDYKNIVKRSHEFEKLKHLLFNNSQNYAFSFLSKPRIIFTDEGKIVVQHELMKTRKDYKLDASKEDSIKYLLQNPYDCKHINQKLLKLIRINF